jgi:threonine/homoserine/homoserine lactone efflux protein
VSDALAACCIVWLVLGALAFVVYYAAVVLGARADRRDRDAARVREMLRRHCGMVDVLSLL